MFVSEGHFYRIVLMFSFTTEQNEAGRRWAQNVKCHFIYELTWSCIWTFSSVDSSTIKINKRVIYFFFFLMEVDLYTGDLAQYIITARVKG